jgi:hypothetical protein
LSRPLPPSASFDSTPHISFEVCGGLLVRQMHHWAALVFLGAIGPHLLRIFFLARVSGNDSGIRGRRSEQRIASRRVKADHSGQIDFEEVGYSGLMTKTYSAANYMAASDQAWGTLGAFIGGLVLVGALVWAVRLGMKVRRREPRRPRPEEQPKLPASGPVGEIREVREPDEVPKTSDEGERLRPQNMHPSASKRSEDQDVPRWESGSSGSFGSGGPGKT